MNSQQWISEFLFSRTLFKGPTGRPLYAYQVTEEEYNQLVSLLTKSCFDVHPAFTKPHPTAACFCLFVAEYYRRYYNGNWDWRGPEDILSVQLAQSDRAILVKRGLEYWQREIKTNNTGFNYLGSLFAEGGLPWPLVSSEQHGFGRAIKRGIKNFYRSADLKRSLTDLMQDYQKELPKIFQNFETIQLLAAIVHQLMSYAQKIPPEYKREPARYLDQTVPDWNKTFPIPLDIANGRQLVNEWLADAVFTEGEQKLTQEKLKAFSAQHYVTCFSPETFFETEVFLPKNMTLDIDPKVVSAMRFETALYEGQRLAQKSIAVYGQIQENKLSVRLSVTQLRLRREKTDVPLFFKLLENGRAIFTAEIDNSTIESVNAPLVAVEEDERWVIAATASCSLKATKVRTLVPGTAKLVMDELKTLPEPVVVLPMGSWFELSVNHSVVTPHDKFLVSLNCAALQTSPFKLTGRQFYGDTSPQTVYLGFPRLTVNQADEAVVSQYFEFFNGIPRHKSSINAGAVSYQVKDAAGHTLYRRHFGLLPADFELNTRAAPIGETALITLASNAAMDIVAETSDVYEATLVDGKRNSFAVTATSANVVPNPLFKIASPGNEKSLLLRQRYPVSGARLLTPDDGLSATNDLLLNQLAGYRILLCAPNSVSENFTLVLTVHNKNGALVSTSKKVKILGSTETLSLYGFYQDFVQLLSVTDDQDAFINIEVKTNRTWLTFSIRRYNARLIREGDSYLTVIHNRQLAKNSEKPQDLFAMSLTDPLQTPVALEKHCSEGVATGLYHTDRLRRQPDLWLVYSPAESEVSFRPCLYVTQEQPSSADDKEINTLHSAARAYHPVANPDVIKRVIAQMAEDYHHTGWQYLAALKQNYSHLPLSTFESWKALAQCPAAMALAIFRLELDESFCLRLRDELAVIFETIPLQVWINTRQIFKSVLSAAGLPEIFVENTIKNRDGVMRLVVSGFDHMTEYLDTGDGNSLRLPSLEAVLKIWYQGLRQNHADHHWPETLKEPLRAWLAASDLPQGVKQLTRRNYTDSVTYLPIFMAYVSVGKATIAELGDNQTLINFYIKQHADFDRRWFLDLHALMVAHLEKYKRN